MHYFKSYPKNKGCLVTFSLDMMSYFIFKLLAQKKCTPLFLKFENQIYHFLIGINCLTISSNEKLHLSRKLEYSQVLRKKPNKKKPAKILLLIQGILESRKLAKLLTFDFKHILKISGFCTKLHNFP